MLRLRKPTSPDAPAAGTAPEPVRKPTSAERAVELRVQLPAAQAAVESADAVYHQKKLTAELNPSDGLAHNAAQTALQDCRIARSEVARLQKELARAEYLASPEHAAKLRVVDGAMADRLRISAAIEDLGDKLFAAYSDWRASAQTMLEQAVVEDLDGGLLRGHDVEAMFRLQLARAGFRWMANGHLDPATIPPLTARVEAANDHIKNSRSL